MCVSNSHLWCVTVPAPLPNRVTHIMRPMQMIKAIELMTLAEGQQQQQQQQQRQGSCNSSSTSDGPSAAASGAAAGGPPQGLCCPISLELMRDPVLLVGRWVGRVRSVVD